MADHGPHSHVCADADGGVCHCDCRGKRHGVRHVPGGRREHDPEVDVHISRIHRPGGGYRVVDRKTGLPPGGGTPAEREVAQRGGTGLPDARSREQRIADRMGEVTTRTRDDLDGSPGFSNDVRARVQATREALPKDRKEWNHSIDQNRVNAESVRKSLAEARKRLEVTEQQRKEAFDLFERQYQGFAPKFKKQYRAELEEKWEGFLQADRDAIKRNEGYLDEYLNPKYDNLVYPKSANGKTTVPDEWKGHLKAVMGVGREALAEHRRGLARDPEYKRLQADAERLEAEAATLRGWVFNPQQPAGTEYREWSRERREKIARYTGSDGNPGVREQAQLARAAVAQHDQARLMAALGAQRKFGGVHHEVELGDTAGSLGGSAFEPARADARELMREAEGFYPADWVKRAAARSKVKLVSSDRAYYWDGGDNPDQGGSYLSMPKGGYDSYSGGHGYGSRAGSLDVSIHELGHRMESSVPGLTQLEMAFVHDRSTSYDGELEEPKQIAGYAEREMSYHDTWANPYAGKTYGGIDPGAQHWEVFQVGVQDTFGRQNNFDKSDDLQHFVIGALLTLG